MFDRHIEMLQAENDQRKVAIVTFESNIELLGDCTSPAHRVDVRDLSNYDRLLDTGKNVAQALHIAPLADTYG